MVSKTKNFYDTCALIEMQERAFDSPFLISDQTLIELESIKTNANKTEELRAKVRNLYRLLDSNSDTYTVIFSKDCEKILKEYSVEDTPDNRIIASAKFYERKNKEPIVFCTTDILCRLIAKDIFHLNVDWKPFETDLYVGYKRMELADEELCSLLDGSYSETFGCTFGCIENEYLIPVDHFGQEGDVYKLQNGCFKKVPNYSFKSKMFGAIKPYDLVQKCAFDSIESNEITVLFGRSGSGKTTIPLSYIMKGIENQKFQKCHIIHHFETLKGAKTLGFEKGEHLEKLLKTGALGNILSSKFGDLATIENMIQDGVLNIVPTANIRGVEFGPEDVVFFTEVQDVDTYTLKTVIQRCKSGCKQIYEGDILEQTDIRSTPGIFRMIEVFKGHSNFGCVKLKTSYRNELGELADKM